MPIHAAPLGRAFWSAYWLLWIPVVAAYGAIFMAQGTAPGRAVSHALANVGTAAALGASVMSLPLRLRWPGSGTAAKAVFLAAQLALAAAFSAAWLVAVSVLLAAPRIARGAEWSPVEFSGPALRWQLFAGAMMYGALTGVAYAVRTGRELSERDAALARAEARRMEAELHALRAHLNPHFLFNTLHSLTGLVRDEPGEVERALERFGDLFRYVLRLDREGTETVTLHEEWSFVRTCLALEGMRLGERLRVAAELDADALECVVPPFTLQPLVENAIRHGIAPRRAGGTLWILARVEPGTPDCLLLEVRDDGAGCAPAAASASLGLGLRAVKQRLEARHSAAALMEIRTARGAGFAVRLRLPAEYGARVTAPR